MPNTTRKLILVTISICLISAVILGTYPSGVQKSIKNRIKRQYLILTGGLVDVGGYRLRIECQGYGSPTVVMDSGLDMKRETWQTVPKEVSKFTRVCVYDRAGLGESEAALQQPRTSENIIADIHKLLQNANENAPFVLVGHSFGGLNMQLYASRYPEDVMGLVLIDSSYQDQYQWFAKLKKPDEREKYLAHEGGENNEHINLLESAEEIRRSPPISSIPLIVLSAESNNPPEIELPFITAHNEMEINLSKISPNSKLIIVKNSGHFIQQDQPGIVIDAIRQVYQTTKKNPPNL
jgi:pimeloyl-ACP methyl ester carboxylesterase